MNGLRIGVDVLCGALGIALALLLTRKPGERPLRLLAGFALARATYRDILSLPPSEGALLFRALLATEGERQG